MIDNSKYMAIKCHLTDLTHLPFWKVTSAPLQGFDLGNIVFNAGLVPMTFENSA